MEEQEKKLSQEIRTSIIDLQKKYPEKRSALIPALHLAQKQLGYLSLEVQQEVADIFGLSLSEVHSVVTFYDMFFEKPTGKKIIYACKNLSCMLRGADELIEHVSAKLKEDTSSLSSEFTLVEAQCLAACDRAPVWIINEKVEGPIRIPEIDALLEKAIREPSMHRIEE